MPYVTRERRAKIDPTLEPLLNRMCECDEGELNYVLSRLTFRWLNAHGVRYVTLNALEGVLACMKAILDRALIAYEGGKRSENGDLPELAELKLTYFGAGLRKELP